MLRNSEELPEGRVARAVRDNHDRILRVTALGPASATDVAGYLKVEPHDARALLQELVATRIHLALVANETRDGESARALARSFLNERFPGAF